MFGGFGVSLGLLPAQEAFWGSLGRELLAEVAPGKWRVLSSVLFVAQGVVVWVLGVTASLVAGDTAGAQPPVHAPAADDFQAVAWMWFEVRGQGARVARSCASVDADLLCELRELRQ
jgi:hypothetical protein